MLNALGKRNSEFNFLSFFIINTRFFGGGGGVGWGGISHVSPFECKNKVQAQISINVAILICNWSTSGPNRNTVYLNSLEQFNTV